MISAKEMRRLHGDHPNNGPWWVDNRMFTSWDVLLAYTDWVLLRWKGNFG